MQNKLAKDGFIGPFSIENDMLLSKMITELDGIGEAFKNLHIENENCQKLISENTISAKIQESFGDNLKVWRTNCFKKTDGSGEVKWHHDRHFENADDDIDFSNLTNHFSILIALTDIDEASGIMEFIPGSHLQQEGYTRDTRPYHKRPLNQHFLNVPADLIEKRITIPLKRGEFMLFHSGLSHRSLPALGSNVKRCSMVARLCVSNTVIPPELATEDEIFDYPIKSLRNSPLHNLVAVVTGGSKGIGKAICKHLLESGCKVAILGRDAHSLNLTLQEFHYVYGENNVLALKVDASDYSSVEKAFYDVSLSFGQINIVFANAGINEAKDTVENLSAESWFLPLESNVKCTFNTCKVAIEYLKSKGGNIITIGSGIGHVGSAGSSSYASAKAVNWIFTKSLAMELIKYNINVNELVPGPVKTQMNPTAEGSFWKEPDDVGPLAVMLASQNLLNGATGQSFSLKRI
ncbi:SDR family NAD(P)-dependent oxidoreductase [Aliiglaciecola sp. SL4]|uniref:SDR family NAD(P)-dependent oxidoreductase n=1 Tax=Aliiglaciecola sp. SL4 TaxID=3239806 RepID=UPI00355B1EBD